MPEDVKCPICGSETVERASQKGPNAGQSFHVCNRYPECKGKVAISEEGDVDGFGIEQEEQTKPPVETKPKTKPKGKLKRPAIGCLVIIGVIFIIGVIGSIAGLGDSTTSPTPTPTKTPTKPAITASEQAYAASVADQSNTLSEAFYDLSELTSNPQIGNNDWTVSVVIQLLTIQELYDKAMDLDPPNSMAAIHLKYIQAMDNYNDATYLFAEGVDELDASLIDEATQKMNTGRQLINEATQLINDFMEAHK